MLEQSIDEQKCLLKKLIEDYELSENPTPEILKSMKSVFSPYKNLGAFYEMNWHLISPILSRASWLEWLSETERENLYYHQLRTGNGTYIHNEYEFSLLLLAHQRLMQTAIWKNKDVTLEKWVTNKIKYQATSDFPITYENWKLINVWLNQDGKYTTIPNRMKKAVKFQIYVENKHLCDHIAEIFKENHYFSDWDTEYLSMSSTYLASLFLMFLSPKWHQYVDQDVQNLNNTDILNLWNVFKSHANKLNIHID